MGRVRALLLDIDGVLTVSWRPLPGAIDALAALRATGVRTAFLTNTTSTTRARVAERLGDAGFDVDADEILTAPLAASAYVREHHPGAGCLLVTSGSVVDDLTGLTLVEDGGRSETDDIDVVLTGGAGPEVTYEVLDRAFRALLGGAALVAMHRNLDWETADGLRLDMGAFVVGLERASGVEAVVVGKPAPAFFAAALAQVGCSASEALMVGDDIEADVLGAQAVGVGGVLVRTGKYRAGTVERAPGRPDRVVASIAEVPALLAD